MPPYRYAHFRREIMREEPDLRPSPGPGDRLPSFDMPTVEGRRARSEHYAGLKLFLMFGSVT